VRIDFDSVPLGTVRADVFVSYARVVALVRDGLQVFAAGGFTLTDFEPPLGIPVSYHAEVFDSSGASLGVTGSSTVVVWGELGYGWFSDPLNPSSAVEVPLGGDFGVALERSTPMQRHVVSGRTVFLAGSRGLLEGIDLFAKTDTLAQADKLRDVLAQPFLLVRTHPRSLLPPLLYVALSQTAEVDADVQWGGERIDWPLVGDEMTRTNTPVAVPAVSYQTYMNAYPTYADAVYVTYLDAMKNPPEA